jgi:L-cysteine/cystine lyase
MVAPFQPGPDKVATIRAALPATGAGIYLDTATAGPLSVDGVAAMRELLAYEERIGRADVDSRDASRERAAEACAVLATLIGATPDAVELSAGTAAGLAWAAGLPAWRPGQRLVSTDREHPAVAAVLATLAASHDVELVRVPVGDASDDDLVARFEVVVDRRTSLLAVSHVTWDTGTVLPVGRLAALARAAGAWSVIDGAQAVGAIPVDVPGLGADVYAFSGYKWLLGPQGVGGLWRSPRAQAAADPPAATLHRPSVALLARTVGWLEMHVGLPWALERAARLAAVTAASLAAIVGVEVLTPVPLPATIVTFRIAGWPAAIARAALARRVFAICEAIEPLDAIRASVGWFNTSAELERFVAAVADLAAATPSTLPERPRLLILPADGGR